jgi:hypothetical protein
MLIPRAQTHSPADIVERFYDALSRHNTGAVEATADRWFAPDIPSSRPRRCPAGLVGRNP